jgi:4-hydroxy-tetrahydrodipicolinate reductase
MATVMRALNAIPVVTAAEPGMLSPLDLPLITGRNTVRPQHRRSLMEA